MPNIEVYGYVFPIENWRKKFSELFAGQSFANELVVTVVRSEVVDLNGDARPFLRVWSSDKEEGVFVQDVLRLHGFDVERPKRLARFRSKPLWTFAEIVEDLRLIQEGKRAGMDMVDVDICIHTLRKHNYALVADSYEVIASELRRRLDGWMPDHEALSHKVDPLDENITDGSDGGKTRLTMVSQIFYSLMDIDI